jgi:hypothetical protein
MKRAVTVMILGSLVVYLIYGGWVLFSGDATRTHERLVTLLGIVGSAASLMAMKIFIFEE